VKRDWRLENLENVLLVIAGVKIWWDSVTFIDDRSALIVFVLDAWWSAW